MPATTAAASKPRRKPRSRAVTGAHMSLRDQAYEALKTKIIHCDLRPGEALTVASLAEDLGLGRTPVIQAVDRLVTDGLVEVMPRKGIVVSPISLNEIFDIIEVRILNECQAVRWAADKASATEIAAMETNLSAMRAASEGRDIERLIQLDREFHRLISAAAGNPVLAEFMSNLHDRSVRFWFVSLRAPDHNARVCDQHDAIVAAIRARDPDAAEAAIRAHINDFQHNITNQVTRNRPAGNIRSA